MDTKTIIIIDDEAIIAKVLKRIIERHFPGITICCVTGPENQTFKEAVALLLKNIKVDLVITDIELRYNLETATEDGRRLSTSRFELGYEIIADLVDRIPCIVMSASEAALDFQDPFTRFAHLRPKIKAFFHKPLPPEDALIATIKNALFPPESQSANHLL